jgi:ribonuclease P protein component
MLKKTYRLPTSFFRTVSRREKVITHTISLPNFAVRLYVSDLPYNRFAVVIRNALMKTIVGRNRLRRMIYSQIREQKLVEAEYRAYDCVLTVTRAGTKQDISAGITELKSKMLSLAARP